MKELSLNILDIAKNSVAAGAQNIGIFLGEDEKGVLTLEITDDGCGMSEETIKKVSDPFYTTRTTRKVGMGIPLLTLAAEQTGGTVKIISSTDPEKHGTTVRATFDTHSIDFTPIGDVAQSICLLIQGSPEKDFSFEHKTPNIDIKLSTAQMREILGNEVSLAEFEVLTWIREYLNESYEKAKKGEPVSTETP